MPQCQLFVEKYDVDARLAKFGFKKEELARIARKALAGRNQAVSIDPQNAAGTFAYNYGVRAIREEYLPKEGWDMDRSNGIEATINKNLGIRLLFQNTNTACDDRVEPRAISAKGKASKNLVNQIELFPEEEVQRRKNIETWFLCVSYTEDDVIAELSLPTEIDNCQFQGFRERIFIIQPGELDAPIQDVDEEPGEDFEVVVTRK